MPLNHISRAAVSLCWECPSADSQLPLQKLFHKEQILWEKYLSFFVDLGFSLPKSNSHSSGVGSEWNSREEYMEWLPLESHYGSGIIESSGWERTSRSPSPTTNLALPSPALNYVPNYIFDKMVGFFFFALEYCHVLRENAHQAGALKDQVISRL